MAKLDGKIALISGGTSGIGAETAKLFQSEGATVVVTGSSERSAEAAKAALPGIEILVSDAGNVAAAKALVDQVKAKHGRIDVLFVNAGIAKFAPIAQVDEAFYDSHFNINVKGAFFLIKHAIPIIPDGGAIILTASVAGANGGLGGTTIYGSTKAALRSFGRTIAKELTPRGIRVNTISPGPIVTPILDKGGLTPAQKDNFIEGAKTRIPLGRTGTAAIRRRQHASHLGFQFRLAFLHAFVTHRFVFRGVRLDLRAIQCHVAEFDQSCRLAQLQNLQEQRTKCLQMPLAEVADRPEVRWIERHNHHKIVPLPAGSGNPPR